MIVFFELFRRSNSYERESPISVIYKSGYINDDYNAVFESINLIQQSTCYGCVSFSIVDTKKEQLITNLFDYYCDGGCEDQIVPIAILDENTILAKKAFYEEDKPIDIITTDFTGKEKSKITTLKERQDAEVYNNLGNLGYVQFFIISYEDDYGQNELKRELYSIKIEDLNHKKLDYPDQEMH